ncbi:MAG: DUF2093 domain-containing protein [Fimbriimonadaceae bacterium]|nr:DUF2093 domain-containing protein [Alphaproteobacteria bacterium]
MNRHDRNLPMENEARLRFDTPDFDIVKPGSFVRCAVSGQPIPLDELRYWSAELQEAYASPEIAFARYVETRESGA